MLNFKIELINRHTYNDCVKLLQRFYKEYKGELIHRIEAEHLLQEKDMLTYVLVVENEVRGLYMYTMIESIYSVVAFILDPLVRQKKIGYMLWKDMVEKLSEKPAIIGIIRTNKSANSIVKKRGHYVGSGLDDEKNTVDYYNLTFKDYR